MSGDYIEYFDESGELHTECMEENDIEFYDSDQGLIEMLDPDEDEFDIVRENNLTALHVLDNLIVDGTFVADSKLCDVISFLQRA